MRMSRTGYLPRIRAMLIGAGAALIGAGTHAQMLGPDEPPRGQAVEQHLPGERATVVGDAVARRRGAEPIAEGRLGERRHHCADVGDVGVHDHDYRGCGHSVSGRRSDAGGAQPQPHLAHAPERRGAGQAGVTGGIDVATRESGVIRSAHSGWMRASASVRIAQLPSAITLRRTSSCR